MIVVAALWAAIFVSFLVEEQGNGTSYFGSVLVPTRLPAFGAAVVIAMALVYFYWRGHSVAPRLLVLTLACVPPFVYAPSAFSYAVPQGICIPFIMALATCGLRWALLTFAVSMALALTTYPDAFYSAAMVAASLIIIVLVATGWLIQQDSVREAMRAKRVAEESEAELRESETKYRTLAEQSPLAIQVFAPDGTTLRVNRAWEALWNTPFAALRQYNLFEDRQLAELGVLPLLEKAFAGETVQLPIHIYDKAKVTEVPNTGGKLWLRAFAYPLRRADGVLREVVVIQEDVTERVLADEEIRNLAFFDPLTQLPNRRLLRDRLEQALMSSQRSREFGALLILDLDRFKTLNDSRGHDVGDALLVEVGKRLKDAIRGGDTVSRLGGDEYVVVLEELGPDAAAAASKAEEAAERLRAVIGQPYVLPAGTSDYQPTCSVGVTLFCGHDTPQEVLFKQADMALYQAKDARRNAIRFFEPHMQAAVDAHVALDSALKRGLEHDEFQLFYQPQVNAAGEITGVEALLRWLRPGEGLIAPGRFIPFSEETGLILPIGKWVLDKACAQIKAWERDPNTRSLPIAVNVSARQFHQADFVREVEKSLQTHGANPSCLKLELTESLVLDGVDEVISKMRALHRLGVEFALDDFGTGFSSLSYLKRLPFERLKIDRSFVRDIVDDPNDAAIVRAILAMSHALGVQVIAEGIETPGQCDYLRENGCQAFQGFLFGKPMPITELESLLRMSDPGRPSPGSV